MGSSLAAPRPGAGPSKLQAAIAACRPLYLPTSVLPALAGCLVAIEVPGAEWGLLPLVLLAMALVHAGVDMTNEVEDFVHGVDTPETVENSGTFTRGVLSVRTGRLLYAGLFLAGAAVGTLLAVLQGGWALMAIGVAGILGGFLYTGTRFAYKYVGLGDPLIVPLMGPLITLGGWVAITGDGFDHSAFWIGLAPGLLICAVLQANNMSDIDGDAAAGVKTIAVRVGFARARALHLTSLALAFCVPPAVVVAGLFGGWVLVPLLLVPLALKNAKVARDAAGHEDQQLAGLAPASAQLHQAYLLLLCVGIVLDRAL